MGRRVAIFFDTPLLARRGLGRGPLGDQAELELHTGILNLFELVAITFRTVGAPAAERIYDEHLRIAEPLTRSRILAASAIRHLHAGRGLSYADAAGYATARELGALFITTDSGFRGLPGVRVVT